MVSLGGFGEGKGKVGTGVRCRGRTTLLGGFCLCCFWGGVLVAGRIGAMV